MHSYLKEKLEGHIYLSLKKLQQFASVQENWIKNAKEIVRPSRHEVDVVEHSSDSLADESSEVLTTEFIWPSKTKSMTCDALKPIQKNRQDNIKYTFDVAKCDRIFNELHKGGYIKLSHTLPSLEELKRRAYCKWHNSFSHATNDCNVFHRQVQSVINERRLSLMEMQIDQSPFPVNKLDLENPAFFIWPEQADTTKGKNVIIGDLRPKEDTKSTPSCKVVMEKLLDGEETITITIMGSTTGSRERGRLKDRLWLTTTESESRPPLTRSRWSDHHPAGQTATLNPHR
jgi:hypothetical protein